MGKPKVFCGDEVELCSLAVRLLLAVARLGLGGLSDQSGSVLLCAPHPRTVPEARRFGGVCLPSRALAGASRVADEFSYGTGAMTIKTFTPEVGS